MALRVKRYPFYIGITTLVVVIVVTLTGMFLWISHRESRTAAIGMADRLFSEINEKTLERYESGLESVAVVLDVEGKAEPLCAAEYGLTLAKLMDAIYASAEQNQAVDVVW